MNDEIIDFYLQVSGELCDNREWCIGGVSEPLRRFAELVIAAERKACAQMFDGNVWAYDYREIAAAIRARGGE